MWSDFVFALSLFWFFAFTCTVQLLFHSLFTFSRHTQEYKATKKQIVRLQLNLDPSTSSLKRKAKKRVLIFLNNSGFEVCWLQLNGKKSMENKKRLMSWYWKQKPTWRKDLIAYRSHPWIMFSFNLIGYHLRKRRTGRGDSFKIGRPRRRECENFGRSWIRGVSKFDNFHRRHMVIIPNYVVKLYGRKSDEFA